MPSIMNRSNGSTDHENTSSIIHDQGRAQSDRSLTASIDGDLDTCNTADPVLPSAGELQESESSLPHDDDHPPLLGEPGNDADDDGDMFISLAQHLEERQLAIDSLRSVLELKVEQYRETLLEKCHREQARLAKPSLEEVRREEGRITRSDPPRNFIVDNKHTVRTLSDRSRRWRADQLLRASARPPAKRVPQVADIDTLLATSSSLPARTSTIAGAAQPGGVERLSVAGGRSSDLSSEVAGAEATAAMEVVQRDGEEGQRSASFTAGGATSPSLAVSAHAQEGMALPSDATPAATDTSGQLPATPSSAVELSGPETPGSGSPLRGGSFVGSRGVGGYPKRPTPILWESSQRRQSTSTESTSSTTIAEGSDRKLPFRDFATLEKIRKAQEALDEPVEDELRILRHSFASKQTKLQRLQQDAALLGIPPTDIASTMGGVSPMAPNLSALSRYGKNRNGSTSESFSRSGSTMIDKHPTDASSRPPGIRGGSISSEFNASSRGSPPLDLSGGSPEGASPQVPRLDSARKVIPGAHEFVRPQRFVDPHVALNGANRDDYFSKDLRDMHSIQVADAVKTAEDFLAEVKGQRHRLSSELRATASSVRNALQQLKTFQKDMLSEARVHTEAVAQVDAVLKADVTDYEKLTREMETYVTGLETELSQQLKTYLKGAMDRARSDYCEAEAAAAAIARVPESDKAIQCVLDADDVKDTSAFLSRLSQQENVVRRITAKVESLLTSLHEGNERFDSMLCCRHCRQRPTGGAMMFALWPCGHTVCEDCLLEMEVDFGEYYCAQCDIVCSDVPNDALNKMVLRTNFKRSGFLGLMDALDDFKEEVVTVDGQFVSTAMQSYNVTRSSEQYRTTYPLDGNIGDTTA